MRAILSFQNIVYIAMWFIVMYSNCLEWNLSQEQTIINLSAMLLLKVSPVGGKGKVSLVG